MNGDYFLGQIIIWSPTFAPANTYFCSAQALNINENVDYYGAQLYSLLGTIYGGDARVTVGLPDLRARVPVGSATMGQAKGLTSYDLGARKGTQDVTLTTDTMPQHSHDATANPAQLSATWSNAQITVDGSNASISMSFPVQADATPATQDTPQTGSHIAVTRQSQFAGSNYVSFTPPGTPANPVELAPVQLTNVPASINNITADLVTEDIRVTAKSISVDVGDAGDGMAFSIMNPVTALNFIIITKGLYPSRN